MFDIKLKYLASVFVDADSITHESKYITDLQKELKEEGFVPLQVFEGPGPGVTISSHGIVKPRIGFHNPDKGIHLVLQGTRFDYSKQPLLSSVKEMGEYSDFLKEASDKLNIAMDYFGRKAHRLAAIKEGFLPEMNSKKLNAICSNLLILSDTFSKLLPFEWDWRVASKIERTFGKCVEKTNTVVSIRRRQGKITVEENKEIDFDRINIVFDINTLPDDSRARFGSKEVNDFFDNINGWQKELEGEISAFLQEITSG